MTQETTADDSFDFESYTETLVEYFIESFNSFYDGDTYDAHGALTEAAFDASDEWLGYDADTEDAIAVLDRSPNEPQEWQPFAEGKDDWRDVIEGMAFTVVRQDLYDALEAEGYLDDHWNPTDKLKNLREN